jgi:A118 family predicted phage portal protein
MIGLQTVKEVLSVDIAISTPMAEALELWTQIYENRAPWVSDANVYSLNLGVAIANEIARATTIEMEVEIDGSPRADFLQEQFQRVMKRIREQVEFGCAKGGLVMKPYIYNDRIYIDFVQADQFFPVKFDPDGYLIDCVFVDQRQIGDSYYTRLEYHQSIDNGYIITNKAYRSTDSSLLGTEIALEEFEEWSDILPQAMITNVEQPLFAYFKYPMANQIDVTSALGVSCYSRATELIEQADKIWSNFLWELDSAQRALYVDMLAFGLDDEGRPLLPTKRLFRTLDTGGSAEAFFEEWSPDIRQEDLLKSLDAVLKKIEFTCGLAYGTISDPQTVDKTATEIKISRQRTYSTIVDTQKALEESLEQLFYAMDKWADILKIPAGEYEAVYEFDDSIIVDKDKQWTQDLQLVGSAVMSKLEFRMRNFDETEDIAREALQRVDAEQSQMSILDEE